LLNILLPNDKVGLPGPHQANTYSYSLCRRSPLSQHPIPPPFHSHTLLSPWLRHITDCSDQDTVQRSLEADCRHILLQLKINNPKSPAWRILRDIPKWERRFSSKQIHGVFIFQRPGLKCFKVGFRHTSSELLTGSYMRFDFWITRYVSSVHRAQMQAVMQQ